VLAYPLVIATPGTVPRHHTEALFQTHGLRLPAGVTETLSVSVARLLACRSDAVWITPERAAGDDLAHGQLARLDIVTSGTKEPVGLLRRSAATPSELASAFMELLTELAQTPR
jgi:DNA-binding transcriptional LysR family regulator